jgi:hypothetical protein
VPGVRADDAYTYGLFRDCGIVILLRRYPAYQGILAGANLDRDMPFTAVEQAALPTDHTVVGALLAQNWWLPGRSAPPSATIAWRWWSVAPEDAGPVSGGHRPDRRIPLQQLTGAAAREEWAKLCPRLL